jgi:hypothetical protein
MNSICGRTWAEIPINGHGTGTATPTSLSTMLQSKAILREIRARPSMGYPILCITYTLQDRNILIFQSTNSFPCFKSFVFRNSMVSVPEHRKVKNPAQTSLGVPQPTPSFTPPSPRGHCPAISLISSLPGPPTIPLLPPSRWFASCSLFHKALTHFTGYSLLVKKRCGSYV